MNRYKKEIGKRGHITYKHNDKYIYSLYNPIKEARKYIDSFTNLKNI